MFSTQTDIGHLWRQFDYKSKLGSRCDWTDNLEISLSDVLYAISVFETGDTRVWDDFVISSSNGTIFHELGFLNYHPDNRHTFHHLMVSNDQGPVSAIPGGILDRDDGQWLVSPIGASIGGPVFKPGASVQVKHDVLEALKSYAKTKAFQGVSMTIAPSLYADQSDDTVGFVLPATGFALSDRWLSYAMDLGASSPGQLGASFSKTRRYEVRKASRMLTVREVASGALGSLYEILLDNQLALGSQPTHSETDLRFLKERFPERVRLFLCSNGDDDIAGAVAFLVRQRVAYVFYLFERQDQRGSHATGLIVAHVAKTLSSEGIRYLDLGPSSFDGYRLNDGLAFFKETFGTFGICRDQWSWRSEAK